MIEHQHCSSNQLVKPAARAQEHRCRAVHASFPSACNLSLCRRGRRTDEGRTLRARKEAAPSPPPPSLMVAPRPIHPSTVTGPVVQSPFEPNGSSRMTLAGGAVEAAFHPPSSPVRMHSRSPHGRAGEVFRRGSAGEGTRHSDNLTAHRQIDRTPLTKRRHSTLLQVSRRGSGFQGQGRERFVEGFKTRER